MERAVSDEDYQVDLFMFRNLGQYSQGCMGDIGVPMVVHYPILHHVVT